ncbi:MAG: lysophospholipid acyltransferase family protein [Gemmatimonadota bacterium]|nr:lysophospholipid acyltransferase family protein [Gemmatimonadota bacterium]MDE2873025.1 lysophospholipid acyltransferase family protein [Gemmatimonadota bacterium]
MSAVSRSKRVRHRVEYALVRTVAALCRAMPEAVADRVGAVLGWMAWRVWRPRWDVVTKQLRMAFPDADEAWWLGVARRSYVHFGAEAVAMFRLAGARSSEILKRTRMIGGEVLDEAAREGRGVMLVSGHLGNWEVGTAGVVARGFAMDIVAARQRNLLFDRYLTRSRERLGMRVIPREEARPGVLASLKAGRVIGIMGDQDARGAGIFVDYFGRAASTARGPALLAVRAGATVATFYTIRRRGWRPRYDIHIEALEEPKASTGRTGGVLARTQAFTSRLEEFVRDHPEQYLWHHRRWKTSPPGGREPAQPTPHLDARAGSSTGPRGAPPPPRTDPSS